MSTTHGTHSTHPLTVARPMRLLAEVFKARQLLTYREGEALVVNDPYLRDRVDVTWTRQGYVWESPTGSLCYGDPGNVGRVVDDIVNQYAGIYMGDRTDVRGRV